MKPKLGAITLLSLFLSVMLCGTPAIPPQDLNGAIELGTINEGSILLVQTKADSLIQQGAKNITLKINSDGGSVEYGNTLIQYFEAKIQSGIHVKCIVDFRARSMAFIFLQSGACQERLATKRSLFMAHEPSFEVEGNRRVHRMVVQYLDALSESMAWIAGNHLKIGVEGYKAKIANGDWHLSYNEALEVGAIDGPIEPKDIPYTYSLTEDNS